MRISFGAAVACSAAACSSAPPPEARPPVVEVAPVAPVATAAPAASSTGALSLTVAPQPAGLDAGRCKPDRGPNDSVIDAYFEVAKDHQLDALLDCFTPKGREAEAKDANSFSHVLSRPGVTIVAHRVTGGEGLSHYVGKKFVEQGANVVNVDIQEGGKAKTLQMTFFTGRYGKQWFVIDITPGVGI